MIKCTTREEDWKLMRTDTTLNQTGEKHVKTGENNKGLKIVCVSAKIHANFILILLDLPTLPQFWFLLILQIMAETIGVSNFLRPFLMDSWNSLLLFHLQLGLPFLIFPRIPWMISPLVFSSIPSRTTQIRFEFFCQWIKLNETCPRTREVSRPIRIPIIIDAFFLSHANSYE